MEVEEFYRIFSFVKEGGRYALFFCFYFSSLELGKYLFSDSEKLFCFSVAFHGLDWLNVLVCVFFLIRCR